MSTSQAGLQGLQNHSVGENYPLTIIGKGLTTEWAVFNCVTGAIGRWFRTQQEAVMDLHSIRLRNMMHG